MLRFKNIEEFNRELRPSKTKLNNSVRSKMKPTEKKSKYHNKKTIVNSIKFDSKKEADYYCDLLIRQKAGELSDIKLQPEFILQDKYRYDGKGIRAITYKADFSFIENGKEIIVDVKGFKNEIYRIKKKMLLFKYPDINFIEV